MRAFDRARYLHYLSLIPAVSVRALGPTTFKIPGFGGSVPLIPEAAIPRVGLVPVPPLRTTAYRPTDGSTDRMLSARFWTDSSQAVTRSVLAELLAMADIPPVEGVSGLGPTFFSKNGRTAYVLLQGAAATLSSVGAEPVDMRTLLPQVTPE
jgi:hypothetical protein